MSQTQSNSTNTHHVPDLGPVVFRCRRNIISFKGRAGGINIRWLAYYVFFPLVPLPYLALMVSFVPFHIFGYHMKDVPNPTFATFVTLFYFLFIWLIYIRPRSHYLVLHENGIHIHVAFNRLHACFDDIGHFFLGRSPSHFAKRFHKIFCIFDPHPQRAPKRFITGNALSVVMKDGTTHTFPGLFACFDIADLNQLLRQLTARNLLLESQYQH